MKLEVFDPAMCCSTGVCGLAVDPTLPQFAADLEWLKSKGIGVERYNLAQQVGAFTANLAVKEALNSKGTKCLPMVLMDGEVKSEGAYPTREQLAALSPFRTSRARKSKGKPVIWSASAGSALRNDAT